GVGWVARDGVEAITVRPEAVDELAAAIQRLLDDDALAARLGGNAVRRAAELIAAAQPERTVEIYRKVVAERRQLVSR
ncbi:MAG TPA: hypothetical protein VEC75_10200, partial [Stellaceae bacterium]|nr:hypothetical protein [Stellaceae bacterium]